MDEKDSKALVESVLARIRPYIESDGATVQLDRIEGDKAMILLRGPTNGCASQSVFIKLSIERMLALEAAGINEVEVVAGLPGVDAG